MRVAIIGAGPTGLVLAAALARRGHRVDLVDRDAGPEPDGSWPRRGVMQFHHAHAIRPQVADAFRDEVPQAYAAWLAEGAERLEVPTPAGPVVIGYRSRRETLERPLRRVVERVPGVTLRVGHVERVVATRGRARGIRIDGADLDADLVIDASGRSSRVTADLAPAAGFGGSCGLAYVDRQYQLRPGAEPGPMLNPVAWQADYDGYQVIVFLHERGIFSVLFVRDTAHRGFVPLRHDRVFDAVAAVVPGLAEWTDPARSTPLGSVLAGGNLVNRYRSQHDTAGRLRLPGLVSLGDAVCTTTPIFGRGIALAMMQIRHLLGLIEQGLDGETLPAAFDEWSTAHMAPWVTDHIAMDAALARRWRGEDLDPAAPLASDQIMAAADVDATIGTAMRPYLTMDAGPELMRTLESKARAVYATGWRPQPAEGPSRAELIAVIEGCATPGESAQGAPD
ncbi:MAG: FAD-dependent oxidoreductase [Dermatophilaceae bacterium]